MPKHTSAVSTAQSHAFWPSDTFSSICDVITVLGFVTTIYIAVTVGARVKRRARLPELHKDFGTIAKDYLRHSQDYSSNVAALTVLTGRVRGKLTSIKERIKPSTFVQWLKARIQRDALLDEIDALDILLVQFEQQPEYDKYIAICGKISKVASQLADTVKDQTWENW